MLARIVAGAWAGLLASLAFLLAFWFGSFDEPPVGNLVAMSLVIATALLRVLASALDKTKLLVGATAAGLVAVVVAVLVANATYVCDCDRRDSTNFACTGCDFHDSDPRMMVLLLLVDLCGGMVAVIWAQHASREQRPSIDFI